MIGQTLAHYEVVALLGRGGMGEVYRARDMKLQRDVALKFLPPDFANDRDRLQRFEREARLLAALSHPNIATLHGFEEYGESHFLVMELIEGEDLSDRLKRGSISTVEALGIAQKLAAGVEAAHEKGIIHRDLKPANIKLTAQGGVRILDFGLARTNEATAMDKTAAMPQTGEGAVLGTAPYMSPEQLKGQPVDARTDIWAFGCVLYEMLAGVSPYAAESSPETVANILASHPDFDRLPRDLAPSVRHILRRCLEKDAYSRWHSIADVRIELESDHEPLNSSAEARRPHIGWIAVAVVAAFAIGALATMAGVRQPAATDTHEPVRLMIPVRDEAAVVPLPESSSVVISRDAKYTAYVTAPRGASGGVNSFMAGNSAIHLRPMGGFTSTPIDGSLGATAPIFSPDGEWLAFMVFHDGMIRKIPRSGGKPRDICSVTGSTIRGMHWPDDGYIYFSDAFGLFAVGEDGGEPRELLRPDGSGEYKTFRFPHLIPGTRSLLFIRATPHVLTYDDAELALLDLDTGNVRILGQGGMDPRYVTSGHIIYGRAGAVFALPFDRDTLSVTGPVKRVLDGVVTSDGYGSMQLGCADDGTLVYVAGGPEQFASEILILDRDGTTHSLGQPAQPYGEVDLAPDAGRAVVSILGANASIWVYDFALGVMTRIVSGFDNSTPIWSRDGQTIVFQSNRSGSNAVWSTASDGSGEPALVGSALDVNSPESFLADDKTLIVSGRSKSTGLDLWILAPDGSFTPLLQTPARELRAQASADGRYVVYTSNESGQLEVYVTEYPTTGRKWKISAAGGDMPRWSQDDRAIYFWDGQKLMMARVDTSSGFHPTRAEVVVELDIEVQDYDVFPDQERFILLARRPTNHGEVASVSRGQATGRIYAAQSPDLRVVLNWFTELQRLAPSR
ncbi:hypothetical protein DRQ53_07550 [bacterium]|nr:MAG: hypothetical protein DRQ53_07550 [bacterium]